MGHLAHPRGRPHGRAIVRRYADVPPGTPVTIETAILQTVLETHVREQLDALADLRVSPQLIRRQHPT